MPVMVQVADSIRCLTTQHGSWTVEKELATVRCKGVALGKRCRDVQCPGIAVREIPLAHFQTARVLEHAASLFVEQMVARDYEPYSEVWVHGPFPSKNLVEWLTDPDGSMFDLMGRRIPDPEAGGLGVEHPELVLPAVFETNAHHKRDYQFIAWFLFPEERLVTSVDWGDGDRSGVQQVPIGAEA